MDSSRDLKIIKKYYGEAMAHFCRDNFATILEYQGKLPEILISRFAKNHFLYQDILNSNELLSFKNFVYNLYNGEIKTKETKKTPRELLNEAGYDLYECKTESDIQKFKKYYATDEKLCTFWSHRLKDCYVFFAVKKNVDEIKREDFKNPSRQDLYGTSVISIQFTRDKSHTLSIKNRYNHTVQNPDATFSNNLDNIIEGLTDSFSKYYGMRQSVVHRDFELDNYVEVRSGKYYKYNYEINNFYYCPNNTVIQYFKPSEYEKEKYLIMDYFILDLVNKKMFTYSMSDDSFIDMVGVIKNIEIINSINKIVKITNENNEITEVTLDKQSRIIKLKNESVKNIKKYFLAYNTTLEELYLPQVMKVSNMFLFDNISLKNISLPNLIGAGDDFLYMNNSIKKVELPNLRSVGDNFLNNNNSLKEITLPKLSYSGNSFLGYNDSIETVCFPSLKTVDSNFMFQNTKLMSIHLPLAEYIGENFLLSNNHIVDIYLPNLTTISPEQNSIYKNVYKR